VLGDELVQQLETWGRIDVAEVIFSAVSSSSTRRSRALDACRAEDQEGRSTKHAADLDHDLGDTAITSDLPEPATRLDTRAGVPAEVALIRQLMTPRLRDLLPKGGHPSTTAQ